MKKNNLKDLLEVVITKMEESSGNKQLFVQLRHKDCKGIFDTNKTLDYHCHQTIVQRQVIRDFKECLERAWFSASMLSSFINSDKDSVRILGLSKEESEYMKKQLWLN